MGICLPVLLGFTAGALASEHTAIQGGGVKHYHVGERIVIPIPLDRFQGGENAFECLDANDGTAPLPPGFVAHASFSSSSQMGGFGVSQCRKVFQRDGSGNIVMDQDGNPVYNPNDWHNLQNKWIEVVAEAQVPGEYAGSMTIEGKPNKESPTETTSPVLFEFVVDAGFPEASDGVAVLFADSSASFSRQIDLNTWIRNVSGSEITLKKTYVDYYLTASRKPAIDVWFNPPGNNSCTQVYKCGTDNFLIRNYLLDGITLANGEIRTMPQVGYRENGNITGDKTEALVSRDFSYTVPSTSYETRAYNRNGHYNDHVALYSDGRLAWGTSAPWLGRCTLATTAEYTKGQGRFCNAEILEEPDGKDTIYEGEDYFFMPMLTRTTGISVEIEPVPGYQSPLPWIEVGTPADYWSGDYDANQNNNVDTFNNRQKIYIRSKHGAVRQTSTTVPGTYKYRIVVRDAQTTAITSSIYRTIVVKNGSDHPEAAGRSVAVLMGDETWFKPYQIDIATGIVNYGTSAVDLSNFRYEYYGQVENPNANLANSKYQPHYWYPSDPDSEDLQSTFSDCGNGRFRVSYRYKKSLLLAPKYSILDYKVGFVYGSTSQMTKTDDYSLGYLDEDPPRRRYNPDMPLYDQNGYLLWGTPPYWADQCPDYTEPPSATGTSAFGNLTVQFQDRQPDNRWYGQFMFQIANHANGDIPIGGDEIRFYYNGGGRFNAQSLNFSSENPIVSQVSSEQCGEDRYVLKIKLNADAVAKASAVYPEYYPIQVGVSPGGQEMAKEAMYSWTGAASLADNPRIALLDTSGSIIYGMEPWLCEGYSRKRLELTVTGRTYMDNALSAGLDKDIPNAIAKVFLTVENRGDSAIAGPAHVDFQVTHPTGQIPAIRIGNKTLSMTETSIVIGDTLRVTRISAGSRHTFRFTLLNGIAANGYSGNIDFLLFDQCLQECSDTGDIPYYLWDLSDDWSATGLETEPYDWNKRATDRVAIYDAANSLLYGIPDASTPDVAPAVVGNGVPGTRQPRAVVGPQVPNRTDAVLYSGGQLLSGGDFETEWLQGWDCTDSVRSVRDESPQGSRHVALPAGSRMTQILPLQSGQLLSDSGAVLSLWHKGNLTISLMRGRTTVQMSAIAGGDAWKLDTVSFARTLFRKNAFSTLAVAASGNALVDDVVLVPGSAPRPTNYATRFTNTAGDEIETRAYDGASEQLVTTSELDSMGRAWKKNLPFALPCHSVIDCNSNPRTLYNPGMARSFYTAANPDYPDAGGFPYVETRWKPDPMATRDVEGAPGKAYGLDSAHLVRHYSSGVNLSGVNLLDSASLDSAVAAVPNIRIYDGDTNYHASADGEPTHLWELEVDRDGRRAFTVKDGEGRIVVSGSLDSTGNLLTRSVNELDARGNVVKAHPPMSCEYTGAQENCVNPGEYGYDSQSRMVRSVEPDAGETRTFYDLMGRVRATQTQRQIDSGAYSVVGYDNLDRAIYTGEWRSPLDSGAARAYFNKMQNRNSPTVAELTPGTVTRTFYDNMPARDTLDVELYPAGAVIGYTRGRVAAIVSDVAVVRKQDDTDSVVRVSSANTYDKYGRVTATYAYDPTMPADSLKMLAVETEYDLGGKVMKSTKYPYGYGTWGHARAVTERYTYDRLGRIDSVFSKNGGGDEVLLATYVYYPTGSVKTVNMGNSLTLTYTYHISGAMKTATVKSASGGELYSETLHYEDCGGSDCDPQYNGNISYMAQRIVHGNRDFVQNRDVAYYYDQQNRLTKTDDLSQDYFDDIFEYDAQGRITAQRRAYRTDSAQGGKYAYYDSTNRLKSVAEGMGGTGDGRDMSAGDNFVYDHDGNLVEDKSKQMAITYDWRGMPVEFRRFSCRSEGYATVCDSTKLIMAYDGLGRRISKTRMKKTAPDSDWYIDFVTHYTDIGTEIRVGGGNDNGTKIVVPMPQGMGRYRIEQAEYPAEGIPFFEWYLKNHLGSTMMVYRTTGTTAGPPELLFAYDYRSYGEQIDLTVSTDKVTENFTGKELDDETDLGYWGARYLDLMLGGWISVDPARQFASPYLYAGNGVNPVNGIDEDGNEFEDKFKDVKSARTDYKNIYNTKSIKEDVEYATIFVKVESIENGKKEQWYTYVKPTKGSQSEVTTPAVPKPIRDKHNPNKILRTYTPVINGDAHTHGSADPNFDWKNPSSTDRENLVTPKGVLFRPDGKVIEYDKNEANDHEIDK